MSKEFQIRDENLIASFDLENEDGNIDFCKLLKVSHGVANEIGMFVDYIATNKIIKDQSKQIADLEAKLAESEKSKESYRLQNEQHHLQLLQFYSRLGVEAFGADIHEKALETLMIMKEQLAEKEKEIEKLNACVDFYKSYSVSFQEKVIDELERVKEFCNNPKNRVEYEYCPNAWTYAVDKDKLMLEIDNQIKQLKEMK